MNKEELEKVAEELDAEKVAIQAEMNSIIEFAKSLGDSSRSEEHFGHIRRRWEAVNLRKHQWFRRVREHNNNVRSYLRNKAA